METKFVLLLNGVPIGVYSTRDKAERAAEVKYNKLPISNKPFDYGFRIFEFVEDTDVDAYFSSYAV